MLPPNRWHPRVGEHPEGGVNQWVPPPKYLILGPRCEGSASTFLRLLPSGSCTRWPGASTRNPLQGTAGGAPWAPPGAPPAWGDPPETFGGGFVLALFFWGGADGLAGSFSGSFAFSLS